MKKNKKLIPKGMYCYDHLKVTKKGPYKTIGPCPYWSIRKGKPKQGNGYCAYLEKGDWDLHEERKDGLTDVKTEKKVPFNEIVFCLGLLWDQVKECGINEEDK